MCMRVVRGVRTSPCSPSRLDQEFLNSVFRELEEQLAIARTEREETQSRAERERRASLKRARELEEAHPTPPPPRRLRHAASATPPQPRQSRLAARLALPSPFRRAASHARTVCPLSQAMREKDREGLALRAQCDAEKEALVKQFEQRVAGLRLEKDQAPNPSPNPNPNPNPSRAAPRKGPGACVIPPSHGTP